MNRKAKLEKALARRYIPSHEVMNAEFVSGLNYHADRLASLHAALIEAVEALEEIQWSWDNDAGRQCSNITEEALAKIDKVLEEK